MKEKTIVNNISTYLDDSINTKIDMVGAIQRNMAGNYAGKVQGIMIGLAFTLAIGTLFLF